MEEQKYHSKQELLKERFPEVLSNVICQYFIEASVWYETFPLDAVFPEDYPTSETLRKYLLQLVKTKE